MHDYLLKSVYLKNDWKISQIQAMASSSKKQASQKYLRNTNSSILSTSKDRYQRDKYFECDPQRKRCRHLIGSTSQTLRSVRARKVKNVTTDTSPNEKNHLSTNRALTEKICLQDSLKLELLRDDVCDKKNSNWFEPKENFSTPEWKCLSVATELKTIDVKKKEKRIYKKRTTDKNMYKTKIHKTKARKSKKIRSEGGNSKLSKHHNRDSDSVSVEVTKDELSCSKNFINHDYPKKLKEQSGQKTYFTNIKENLQGSKYTPIHVASQPATSKRPTNAGSAVAAFYQLPLFQHVREELCPYASTDDFWVGRFLFPQHRFLLSELLKRCLLNQQQERVSLAILGLCFNAGQLPEMVWKIGCWLLKSTPHGQPFLSNFQNSMKTLCHNQCSPEIYLDIANDLITKNQNLYEAYQTLTAVVSIEPFSSDAYFNLFYGQLEYALWKIETSKKDLTIARKWDDDSDNEDAEDAADLQDNNLSRSSFHGHRALQYLRHVEERMGLWDTILPKYLELIEHYDGVMKAVEVAEKHLQNNPENPNSYRLVYLLLKESKADEESLTRVLKSLSVIDSTNELVKELIIYYQRTESYSCLFDLLIQRLDHVACIDSYFDWSVLYNLIRTQKREILTKFEELKRLRVRWIKVHFPVPLNMTNQRLSEQTLKIKSKLAIALHVEYFEDCVTAWLNSRTLKYASRDALSFDKCIQLGSCEESSLCSNYDDLNVSTPELTDISDVDDIEHDGDPENFSCNMPTCAKLTLIETVNDNNVSHLTTEVSSSSESCSSDHSTSTTFLSDFEPAKARTRLGKHVRSKKTQKKVNTNYDTVSLPSSSSNSDSEVS
ncbi:uncharacterized protein LOC130647921 [Hydractinia symbiolongicarpus]|uniref:uncharacterized protein LOC130647921 n=1 Tax=Hydractinia symbiolongicarpus TaxID=13093 RepID=UPI00254CB37D|nr:uncharacterized protein LOC130647921 [Hydractinia symbiolongicarpus]